jgi:hypothetical protein
VSGVNVPLLRTAVEWAEAEAAKPAESCQWHQADFVADAEEVAVYRGVTHVDCGTCYCIAGYISQLLDARYATSYFVDDVSMNDFAMTALGIESETGATALFAPSNTIEDVRRYAEELAGERL